ncbi:MAG: hypothetical protein IKB65_04120 [Ruminiclostridium sp.]|nr:hypothetical protein [Ruminiclostridium sp.]
MPQLDPRQVQDLLKNQALRQTLSSPETQKLLGQLKKQDPAHLQAAAQAAMQGDASGLAGLLRTLSRDPDTARAVEELNRKLSK